MEKEHSAVKEKEEIPMKNDRKDEPWGLPWLHLLDSNGELPKNYEQILAKEEKEKAEAAQSAQRKNQQDEQQTEKPNNETLRKQCHLPWLHLIDDITGELPKNYKQILAQEERQKAGLERNNEHANDSKFTEKTAEEFNNSKLFQSGNQQKTYKLPKKSCTTKSSNLSFKSNCFKTPKLIISSCKSVEKNLASKNKKPATVSSAATKKTINNKQIISFTPINVESSPHQPENHFRRQLFTSTPGTEQETSPKTPSPLADSVLVQTEAVNSDEKFIQLENLLRTPKQTKFNSLQKLEAYIKESEDTIKRQIKALDELKGIYNTMKMEASTKSSVKDRNKQKLNLRVDVLKKAVNIDEKENVHNKALNRYVNLKKSNIDLLQTPNYDTVSNMRKKLSKKVMNQCLMLEDTPKK